MSVNDLMPVTKLRSHNSFVRKQARERMDEIGRISSHHAVAAVLDSQFRRLLESHVVETPQIVPTSARARREALERTFALRNTQSGPTSMASDEVADLHHKKIVSRLLSSDDAFRKRLERVFGEPRARASVRQVFVEHDHESDASSNFSDDDHFEDARASPALLAVPEPVVLAPSTSNPAPQQGRPRMQQQQGLPNFVQHLIQEAIDVCAYFLCRLTSHRRTCNS
jgi:hypothetical protein